MVSAFPAGVTISAKKRLYRLMSVAGCNLGLKDSNLVLNGIKFLSFTGREGLDLYAVMAGASTDKNGFVQ
jgi:hypothetical protein